MKFMNKNAYIEIAVYGYSYLQASRQAFEVVARNAIRLIVIDGVGSFLIFLGKLGISFGISILGAYLLRKNNELVTMYAVPLFLIFILSWTIASCFGSILDMAMDTMFICFCEDVEHNNGADRPYFMPDRFKQYLKEQPPQTPVQQIQKTSAL